MPLCGRKSAGSIRRKVAEVLALFLGDGGAQVLNLDQILADEHDLGDIGDASHPRMTNNLRIQRQQSLRILRISTRGCFPLEHASLAVNVADGIDISDEVVAAGNLPREFDLQIPLRLTDLDTIVLAEPA